MKATKQYFPVGQTAVYKDVQGSSNVSAKSDRSNESH